MAILAERWKIHSNCATIEWIFPFSHTFECFRGVRGAVVRCCIRIWHILVHRRRRTVTSARLSTCRHQFPMALCTRKGKRAFQSAKPTPNPYDAIAHLTQFITHSGWMGRRGRRIRPHYLFTFVFMVFYSSSAAMRLNVYKKHLSPQRIDIIRMDPGQ